MPRSLLLVSLVTVACFSESGTGGTANDGGSESTGAGTSTTTLSGSSEVTGEASGSSVTPTDSGGTSTTKQCSWPLEWKSTDRKDIVVIVQEPPSDPAALVMRAEEIATVGGVHIALATGCDEACLCCGNEGDGFEHQTMIVVDDPLEVASMLEVGGSFFREGVPRHLVVLPMQDTMWTPDMLATDPRYAGAQIHVRGGACGTTATLDMLADATHGSVACGTLEATDILDEAVLLAFQPGCELDGDPAMGPPPGTDGLTLELTGTLDDAPVSSEPEGPDDCGNDPASWTILDADAGNVLLCPATCRDAGDWLPDSLAGTIAFPC